MAGPRLEQNGLVAANNFFLKARHDRPGRDRLTCEQITGSDQDSHLDAADGQRAGERGDQRGRTSVVNPSGEDETYLLGCDAAVECVANHGDRLFPENEAGPRAHVPTAFTAFEHEATRSIAKILVEQARRGNVQIGCDSLAFQAGRLVGSPARKKGEWRAKFPHDGQLFGAQLWWHEAQDAYAPGPPRKLPGGFPQELADFCFAQERQSQERQASSSRDSLGKARDVADPCHRALKDRKPRSVGAGKRRRFRQRPAGPRGRDSLGDRSTDGLHNSPDGHVFAGQPFRERRILTRWQTLAISPTHKVANG